jgi:hypothetical protein
MTALMPYSESTTTTRAVLLGVLDQLTANRVDRAEVGGELRITGPEPLQVVVEMRQVDERERRLPRVVDVLRAVGDPARRGDVGARSPVVEQREVPSFALSSSRSGIGCV